MQAFDNLSVKKILIGMQVTKSCSPETLQSYYKMPITVVTCGEIDNIIDSIVRHLNVVF